jgi:hypothetical protein
MHKGNPVYAAAWLSLTALTHGQEIFTIAVRFDEDRRPAWSRHDYSIPSLDAIHVSATSEFAAIRRLLPSEVSFQLNPFRGASDQHIEVYRVSAPLFRADVVVRKSTSI